MEPKPKAAPSYSEVREMVLTNSVVAKKYAAIVDDQENVATDKTRPQS